MARTVLIQEPDEVISLDLAQIIKDAWPEALVVLCRGVDMALARLGAERTPDVIILRQSLRAARASGLAERAMGRGVQVLLTAADADEAAQIAAMGWRAVEMPFTTHQVQAAVGDLMAPLGQNDSHCKAATMG